MNFILIVHILTGVIALGSGAFAIISKKQRGAHSKSGNMYFYSMLVSALTAVALSTLEFNPFLFGIALFTLYLIIGGKMALVIRRQFGLAQYWKYYAFSGLLTAGLMVFFATQIISQSTTAAIILFVFAGIQLSFSGFDLWYDPLKNIKHLIFQHINKMGGGYIATCTAFIVVNINFLPDLVTWLGPTLIGSLLIAIANRQRRNMQSTSSTA